MTVPNWFWPASGTARGVATAAWGGAGQFIVADWSAPQVWPFNPAAGTFGSPISLPISGVTSALYPGLIGAAPAASGGAYVLNSVGDLWTVPSGGIFSSGYTPQYLPPPSGLWTGLAAGGPSGLALAVASSGSFTDSAASVSGHFGSVPAWYAAADSSHLFTLLPSIPAVGFAGIPGGVTGAIALPATGWLPSCLTVSGNVSGGGRFAVGGWYAPPPLSGAVAAVCNPVSPTYMLAVTSGGAAMVWNAPAQYADAWSLLQSLAVGPNFSAVAWRPDGVQALATSTTSGTVSALTFTTGTIALAQTIVVSGACGVAIAGDSLHALVAQSGQSRALPLTFSGGVWVTGTAVTGLAGIVAVASLGPSGAYAACTAGLVPLALASGSWTVGTAVGLPFVPKVLTIDTFGQAYAAASGAVALVSGGAITASGTWSGAAPTSIAVQQGRIVMAVPSDNLMRVYGLSGPGTLTQQSSTQLVSTGAVGLGLSATTLFAMASSGTATYGFSGTPYQLTVPQYGAVGVYVSGTGWSTATLGVGHAPSALTFGTGGNIQVATVQNTWWTLTSGAVFSASGIIAQYAPQAQSVPLGVSSLVSSGSHLYAATSLPGVLIELV